MATWQSTAKAAAYEYPALKAALNELRSPRITQSYDAGPRSAGSVNRPTEMLAARELPTVQAWTYNAVEMAVTLNRRVDGGRRLKLAEMMYFRPKGQRLKLADAAKKLAVPVECAKDWDRLFLEAIAGYLEQFSGGALKLFDDDYY